MQMPGRTFSGNGIAGADYRYGHNGQENQNEIFKGAYSADFWMYDSRLGRRWETDPVVLVWQSPYVTFDNSPIALSDEAGLQTVANGPVFVGPKAKPTIGINSTGGRATIRSGEQIGVNVKEYNSIKSSPAWAARVANVAFLMFMPANSDYKGAGSCCGTEMCNCNNLFKTVERIYTGPLKSPIISDWELNQVKYRVETGQGSFNDHKIYNENFAPRSQGPFKTQKHHVIPVAVFEDVSQPLIAIASKDPEFKKWANSEENLLPLGTDVHGNHPAYSAYVKNEINKIYEKYGNVDSKEALQMLKELSGKMKGEINNRLMENPGKRLNEVFGGGTNYGGGSNSGSSSGGSGRPRYSCFVGGTKIMLTDSTTKYIEEINVGDTVLTYNFISKQLERQPVLNIVSPNHQEFIKINFSDGMSITNTEDHSFYVNERGWCSINPDLTRLNYGIKVTKLHEGDKVITYENGLLIEKEIISIKEFTKEIKTYNIYIRNNNNYFANGILVYDETIIKE